MDDTSLEEESTSNVFPVESTAPQDRTTNFAVTTVTAEQVPGKVGFVYSPYMEGFFQVDVRGYRPGERVRCPYTKKSFNVPGARSMIQVPVERTVDTQLVSAPERTAPSSTPPNRTEMIVEPKPRTETEPMVARTEPTKKPEPEPKVIEEPVRPKVMAGGVDKIPASTELLELPKPKPEASAPVGTRVPGKPNYVFSPFAASNQVVDVEGHAPGTKVKCPYTGKIFTVPSE